MKMEQESVDQIISCPFCGEDDFDLLGLQWHLERRWCVVYGTLTIGSGTMNLMRNEKKRSAAEAAGKGGE